MIAVVDFTYRLTGTGWAEATLTDHATNATVPASYLVDTLRVVLDAIYRLLEGAEATRCSWELEPGEYRWIFTRDDQMGCLRLLAFEDAYRNEPDSAGVVVFETSAPIVDMAAAFARGAQTVLDEHGEAGYLDRWVEHPFPTDRLKEIQATLSS